mmetsp:Transcript_18460/g.43168  ORF Transcript_18460/g.43168 Transcript_18460/m.43168 type:complete len:334 (+) Transcript_18460:1052-2053(+)
MRLRLDGADFLVALLHYLVLEVAYRSMLLPSLHRSPLSSVYQVVQLSQPNMTSSGIPSLLPPSCHQHLAPFLHLSLLKTSCYKVERVVDKRLRFLGSKFTLVGRTRCIHLRCVDLVDFRQHLLPQSFILCCHASFEGLLLCSNTTALHLNHIKPLLSLPCKTIQVFPSSVKGMDHVCKLINPCLEGLTHTDTHINLRHHCLDFFERIIRLLDNLHQPSNAFGIAVQAFNLSFQSWHILIFQKLGPSLQSLSVLLYFLQFLPELLRLGCLGLQLIFNSFDLAFQAVAALILLFLPFLHSTQCLLEEIFDDCINSHHGRLLTAAMLEHCAFLSQP